MKKLALILLPFVILCTCFYGCGGNNGNAGDILSPAPSDGQPGAKPAETQPADLDEPANLPPAVPEDFGPAPGFQLPDLDGNLVSLADFAGQVVVINFWATWCPNCVFEMPDFVAVRAEHQDKEFEILGLSRDVGLKPEGAVLDEVPVRAFVKQIDVNYPILWDTKNVMRDFKVEDLMPATFVLDRNHNIRFRHAGRIVDKATLQAQIFALLQ